MSIRNDDPSKNRGFSGLVDLTSTVEPMAVAVPAPKSEAESPPSPSTKPGGSAPSTRAGARPSAATENRWLLGVGGAAVIVLPLLGLLLHQLTASGSSSPPPESPIDVATDSTSSGADTATAAAGTPNAPPGKGSKLLYSAYPPPISTTATLDLRQLSYCYAEKIRLDTELSWVLVTDDNGNAMLDQFIADYNSRCSRYYYKEGVDQTAHRAVDDDRPRIEEEARSRIPQPATLPSTPDPRIMDVQQRLTQLGYPIGKADGLGGPKLKAALQTFQTAEGIGGNGLPTIETYNRLVKATLASDSGKSP